MNSISAKGLGKKYKRYSRRWGRLLEWLSLGHYEAHDPHWVLRGIDFELAIGQAVGIIGQNGAGKSTLLKILAGTVQSSEGSILVNGRVAALLELGMGFHPEFTGRQNAIMACQMIGFSGQKARDLLPEIIEFSELADYIDQPLRTYSSGMQVRLAFSVATVVKPDVLIVDEALSVGDTYFQHKSIARIRDFQKQGMTLLFVSHSPAAIKTLCNRALLLDQGVLVRDGNPDDILDYYNAMIAKKEKDAEIRQVELAHGRKVTRSGNKRAEISVVEMLDSAGKPARAFRVGDTVNIKCQVDFNDYISNPTVGILIRDRLGNDVFGINTFHLGMECPNVSTDEQLDIEFEVQMDIGYGNYSLTVAVHSKDTHMEENYDWWDRAVAFQVIPNDGPRFVGTAALPVRATVNHII